MDTGRLRKMNPAYRRILLSVLLVGVTVVWAGWNRTHEGTDKYVVETISPTCTESGYSLYSNQNTGEVQVRDVTPPTGHTFNEWALSKPIEGIHCGFLTRTCITCNAEETQANYPELGISRISLYGSMEGIGKKNAVPMTAHLELIEDDLSLDCFATLKLQGHISLNYEKKNYTLKLFEDTNRKEKLKLTLSHWNKENKYILKANAVDTSQCRNLVCASLWADICDTRSSLPEEFTALSNNGAVDGFPVALYINDSFHGLYTMNLHKDDDLFGMEENEHHAVLICNHSGKLESYFRAQAEFTEDSPWEVEFCGTEDDTWAKEKLNDLIEFVMTSNDTTFRNDLSQYIDVDAAIDYLISIYALGLTNHGAQDLVLVSYGGVWIPSLYDMETAFGLSEEGIEWCDPSAFLPAYTADGWSSGTGNLLWDRLLQNFSNEIFSRYCALRAHLLDPQEIIARVNQFTNKIPTSLYQEEDAANPHPHAYTDHITQIQEYIPMRIALLDQLFL